MRSIGGSARPLVGMTLPQLRALIAVDRCGSFSRAADQLQISQPTVSVQISELEHALGVPLMDRARGSVRLTPVGRLLVTEASRALAILDSVGGQVEQARGRVAGRVRIGTGATAAAYLLPRVLRALRKRFPDLQLVVSTGDTPTIVRQVTEGELEIGLVTRLGRPRHLKVTPFCSDRLVAVGPPGAWDPGTTLSPRALGSLPLILYPRPGSIRAIIETWFERAGIRPGVEMEMSSVEAIKKLVGVGLGYSILSEVAAADHSPPGALALAQLAPRLERELVLVRRRDRAKTPAFQAVVGALAKADGGGSPAR